MIVRNMDGKSTYISYFHNSVLLNLNSLKNQIYNGLITNHFIYAPDVLSKIAMAKKAFNGKKLKDKINKVTTVYI